MVGLWHEEPSPANHAVRAYSHRTHHRPLCASVRSSYDAEELWRDMLALRGAFKEEDQSILELCK